jgi:uncharacterized membrane protein YraQ (UPF0718 family)
MSDRIIKIPNGMIFLFIVVLIYGVSALTEPDFVAGAFGNFLVTFSKVLPILLIVYLVMFFSFVFVKPEMVKRQLGRNSGIKGWVYAIIGSIVISGPSYVLFPLLGELRKEGMKYSLIAVFMSNRNVQLAYLPVIAYYFGWRFSFVFAFYVLAFSLLTGMLMGKVMRGK